MTRIGTFVQIDPHPDEQSELFGMADGDGGIFLGVKKRAAKASFKKFDVLMHLSRKEAIQLEMLLGDAIKQQSSDTHCQTKPSADNCP